MLQIEIHAERNEILDQSSLIMRYQAEIAALRRQLEEAARGKGVVTTAGVDPLHPEVSCMNALATVGRVWLGNAGLNYALQRR